MLVISILTFDSVNLMDETIQHPFESPEATQNQSTRITATESIVINVDKHLNNFHNIHDDRLNVYIKHERSEMNVVCI